MLKNITELRREDPFKAIFPINPLDLQAITNHMRKHGYDPAQPVVVWKGKDQVVDGFTRIKAAEANNLKQVHIVEKEFKDDIAAIKYTVHLQRDRRNLTSEQFTKLLQTVDQRLQRGGDRKSSEYKKVNYKPLDDDEVEDAKPGTISAELTADILGTSPSTVKKTRKIIDSDDPEVKQQLKDGASINKIHSDLTKKEKQSKEKNTTSNHKFIKVIDKVDWAGWVLNPTVGCSQGCKDCPYIDIVTEIYDNFDVKFYPERLEALKNTKAPSNISPKTRNVMLCEMGDMLNPQVEDAWIEQIIEATMEAPQWNFLIRTKFPQRYNDFIWPDNTWLGATVTSQAQADAAGEVFKNKRYRDHVQFLSFTPLLEDIILKRETMTNINWVIIGANGGTNKLPACQPEWNWVENIVLKARENLSKVYFMPNLKVAPKEIPDVYIPEVVKKNLEK